MNVQVTHSADASTVEDALAADNQNAVVDSTSATALAMQNTLLTPRFYTTDFDEMDAIDVTPVREDWDNLIAQMKADPNKGHFKKNADWDKVDWEGMEPALKREFIDFLVSSCTAEFSGCVLYKEMKRRGSNDDIVQLFQLMARDEARHAGFINDALREAGVSVNLGFLTQKKKYTYFRPKFIYYATYLSEKIGYARYITIYRHLEQHPEKRFHPIFKWFREWCNDEFSHGEAFALLMKTDPKLTQGKNVWWIKFFLTAVYGTMYVRDHQRPEFHKALGVDPDWYAHEVFTKTSEISKQVFPITLDIEHPRWQPSLERLQRANADLAAAQRKTGAARIFGKLGAQARAAMAFASLFSIPVKRHDVAVETRMEAGVLMSSPWIAALVALFVWWFSTGAILYVVKRADKVGGTAHVNAALLGLPVLGLGWFGLVHSAQGVDLAHVYIAFLSALAIWGWFEMAFLTGVITGPNVRPLPDGVPEWERFLRAWGTIAYSEVALLACLMAILAIGWDAPNEFGMYTFVVLFVARISAKLNVYLGVPNINVEFLPRPVRHLASHFRVARMNALFPLSVTLITFAVACWIERAIAADGAAVAGFGLLAALTTLALVEHWAMVLPLQDAKLWRWMIPQQEHGQDARVAAPTSKLLREDGHGLR